MVEHGCLICMGFTILLLVLILIPLSFSYVEYYEYGLAQRKTTGAVDTTVVFSRGRYALGPDKKFIKYQSDSHYVMLDELSVFSAGGSNESIGLEFRVDIDFTFLLIEEEIGDLHKELAFNYENVITSRAKDAIKNEAIFVTFTEYFQDRKSVEARFRQAVQERWEFPPSLHCTLDQFHLGRIQIPESVASKQLQSRVQNEKNDEEEFLQQAQLERELTAVEVNAIGLERNKTLRTAEARASLIRKKAIAEARLLTSEAAINGSSLLVKAANFQTQDHKTTFSYIRALKERANLDISVSYLDPESVIRTTQA